MRYKILLVTAPLLAFSYSLFAVSVADSVGVENLNGKKVILHKLDPKDNFYSIARRYNVKPAAVIDFNKNVKMSIGNIVKVPTDRPFIDAFAVSPAQTTVAAPVKIAVATPVQQDQVAKPQQTNTGDNSGAIQYKVSAGETLFAISKRFGTTVDDIMATNNLKSNALVPGQILMVRQGPPPAPKPPVVMQQQAVVTPTPPPVTHTDVYVPVAKRDSTIVVKSDSVGGDKRGTNRYGLNEKNEKGIATWIDDASLDPNKKLVLHRTAPVGTVIKITNPMTNRTTFAKVVGRFTDTENTKDVIIVMTKNTAESLGALDKRFHVNISYGIPND